MNLKTRANRRKFEFMQKHFKVIENETELNKLLDSPLKKNCKRLIFRYMLTPVAFNGVEKINSIKLLKNNLEVLKNNKKT